MSVLETDTLAELIGAKHQRLLQLRDLSRKQLELIDGGNMTALLDLLAIKQRSLLQLQQIERELAPFRKQDAENRNWRSPRHRQDCAEQLRECEALLGEVVAREKRGEDVLKQRRDEVALKLQGVHTADTARGAYAAQSSGVTNELDLFSDA